MYNLAHMLATGADSVATDLTAALQWFERAARKCSALLIPSDPH